MAESKNKKSSASSSTSKKLGQSNGKVTAQATRTKGTLFIIGGREDRANERVILRALVERVGTGKLVVATVASDHHEEIWEDYERVFRNLGIKHLSHLSITHREEPPEDKHLKMLQDAKAVFFTGGDQLKITAKISGTPLSDRLEEIFREGGIIAGTSAGASVMSATMVVATHDDTTHKIGASLMLAPGLGLVKDMIIDQHFSERGRIGRLLGAVAQNPRMLGVGIDENTAIILEAGKYFQVLGSGAVYVLDGHGQTFSNISEATSDRTLSVFNLRLHILGQNDRFDLVRREPVSDLQEAEEITPVKKLR